MAEGRPLHFNKAIFLTITVLNYHWLLGKCHGAGDNFEKKVSIIFFKWFLLTGLFLP